MNIAEIAGAAEHSITGSISANRCTALPVAAIQSVTTVNARSNNRSRTFLIADALDTRYSSGATLC
jgi:hypothetical protein